MNLWANCEQYQLVQNIWINIFAFRAYCWYYKIKIKKNVNACVPFDEHRPELAIVLIYLF